MGIRPISCSLGCCRRHGIQSLVSKVCRVLALPPTDYMQEPAFAEGIDRLLELARAQGPGVGAGGRAGQRGSEGRKQRWRLELLPSFNPNLGCSVHHVR